jgi:hypothetical protein
LSGRHVEWRGRHFALRNYARPPLPGGVLGGMFNVMETGEKLTLSTRVPLQVAVVFHISQCEILKFVQMLVDKGFGPG